MVARNIGILFSVIILCPYIAVAQSSTRYKDSIDHYQKFADSMVYDFTVNVASSVQWSGVHYNCAGKKGGAYAELYGDSTGNIYYRLTRQSTCDSLYEDKAYYFISKKIVLIMDGVLSEGKRVRKYYKDDMLVFEKGIIIDTPVADDKDLAQGYKLLEGFTRH